VGSERGQQKWKDKGILDLFEWLKKQWIHKKAIETSENLKKLFKFYHWYSYIHFLHGMVASLWDTLSNKVFVCASFKTTLVATKWKKPCHYEIMMV
jgi:hypothetical protein